MSIESHKWNISTGPSVRCQVFPILPCVSPSVWHGFWSQPTLVEMLDSSVWRVGLVVYSVLCIFSHQSTALVIKMSMMMKTENNYASKEISANHDQCDVADVADGYDEDNHNLSPIIHPHMSTLHAHKQLPSCNCLKKEPLPIDPIGPKKWEKWSLERSIVGMASPNIFGKKLLIKFQNLKISHHQPNSNLIKILSSTNAFKGFSNHFQNCNPINLSSL